MSAGPAVGGLRAVFLLARGRTEGIALLAAEPSDVSRSFIAMALAMPPIIALRSLHWSTGPGVPADAARILTLDLLIYAVSWLAFVIISVRLADRMGRAALWPRFVITYNWCNVLANVMILAGSVPGMLGVPPLVDQVSQVVVTGWALWLEWYAIRLTLRTGPLLAMYLVLVDQMIGLVFTVAGLSLGGR
jgi:hypothetical protein